MGEPPKERAESLVSGYVSGEQDILFVERVGGGVVGRKGRKACKRGWGQILGDVGVQAEIDFPSDYRGAGKGMQGLARSEAFRRKGLAIYSEQRDFLPTTPPPSLSTNNMLCSPDTHPLPRGTGWGEAGSGRQAPGKPEKDPEKK